MKYYPVILILALCACSSDNSQNADHLEPGFTIHLYMDGGTQEE